MDNHNNNLPLILNEKRVFIIRENIVKKDLVAKLVHSICAELSDLNEEEVLSSVLKREQGISTTLDTGLSIPHARIEDLEAFQAAAAVLPNPIKDDYGLDVKVMFLFLSPAGPAFFSSHLKLLAALAEKFNPDFIKELGAMQDERLLLKSFSL